MDRAELAAGAADDKAPLPIEKAAVLIDPSGLKDVDGEAWRSICEH